MGRGLSIGIAIATSNDEDVSSLLSAADDALYEAKRAGRGRAAIATPGQTTERRP
jgi:PleD family two-component response regulator